MSFLDFKTLDAKDLVRVVQIVGEPLPDGFQTFFDDLRKRRNRISHLNAGNFRVEARSIVVDIMRAHRFLFPDKDWLSARRSHIETTVAPLIGIYDDDPSSSLYFDEVLAVLAVLTADEQRAHLGVAPGTTLLQCPECLGARTRHWDHQSVEFVQRREGGTWFCIACRVTYSENDFKEKCLDCWGEEAPPVN